MGSFSFVTGYQHFQSGTLMPVGEKGSIPLLTFIVFKNGAMH